MGCNRFRGEFQWGRLSRGYLHGLDLDGGVGNTDDSVATSANPAQICPPPCMGGEISVGERICFRVERWGCKSRRRDVRWTIGGVAQRERGRRRPASSIINAISEILK